MISGPEIEGYARLIREVIVAPHVKDFAIRLVLATHPGVSSRPSERIDLSV